MITERSRVRAAVLVAPLRIEARALRAGAPRVVHAGMHGATLPPGDEPVVVAGFGGALAEDLLPGTIVVASEVTDPDAHTLPCDASIAAALTGFRVRVGRLASARKIVRGAERERLAATGAVAVDMESYWLRQAAGGRPFAAVRVIVDTPHASIANPFAMLRAGVPAYRVLRDAARSLAGWSPSTLNEPDE